MNCMKFFFQLLVIICFVSCKKNETQPVRSDDILMAHSWFPYQIQVVTLDSTTVNTYDSVGHRQTNTTGKKSDTTFLTSQCSQQSTYNFQQNGALTINDICNATAPNINGTWTITQTNILSIQYTRVNNSSFHYFSTGLVSKIDNSSFIYHSSSSEVSILSSSDGPNNTVISTYKKVLTDEYTTYKSK